MNHVGVTSHSKGVQEFFAFAQQHVRSVGVQTIVLLQSTRLLVNFTQGIQEFFAFAQQHVRSSGVQTIA